MPLPKTSANYHGQLGIPHKGRAIKELVGCWVLNNVILRVYRQKMRYRAPLIYPSLLDLTLECHGRQPCP